MGGCQACNCGTPALLVAVESSNGATSNDGRVLQIPLGTSTAPSACRDLTAGKTLPKSPTALGWLQPRYAIWGAPESVTLIDSVKDLVKWNYQDPQHNPPLSVFPLERGTGGPVVAIGYDSQGFNTINLLNILDIKSGNKLFGWDVTDAQNSPIYLGSEVPSMAQSPIDPTHIFFVDNGSNPYPASDIPVPYDGKPVKATVYWMNRPNGNYLKTINTVRTSNGGGHRTVWLQYTNSTTINDAVFYTNDDGTGPSFTGPLSCSNPACLQPFKSTDAVADPTTANRVIATCQSASDQYVHHVVTIDDNGTCNILYDGTALPMMTYPVALAIAEAQ
jgi:hypothetical protein